MPTVQSEPGELHPNDAEHVGEAAPVALPELSPVEAAVVESARRMGRDATIQAHVLRAILRGMVATVDRLTGAGS